MTRNMMSKIKQSALLVLVLMTTNGALGQNLFFVSNCVSNHDKDHVEFEHF